MKNIISLFIFLGIASFLSLEFIFGLEPCKLCLIQRIPFYIAGALCILSYTKIFSEKTFLNLIILLFIIAFGISIFHILVENEMFEFSCNLEVVANTIEDLKLQLQAAKPDCSDKSYIFGLRITYLSSIFDIFMVFLAGFVRVNKKAFS